MKQNQLSNELKFAIEKETMEKQGDIYKFYISKSKNSKHSQQVREEAILIAEYALFLHNKKLMEIKKSKEPEKVSKRRTRV
jgi:hypothetical protein